MGVIKPNKRKRSEFLHIRTLLGMSKQERADFSYADLRRFFKVSLWDRSHTCMGCKKEIKTFEEATLDHIIPRSKGGRTRLVNLQLMHKDCNSKKSSTITTRLSRRKFQKAMTAAPSHRNQPSRYELEKAGIMKPKTPPAMPSPLDPDVIGA